MQRTLEIPKSIWKNTRIRGEALQGLVENGTRAGIPEAENGRVKASAFGGEVFGSGCVLKNPL